MLLTVKFGDELVCSVDSSHSMTLYEILEFCGAEFVISEDDPRYSQFGPNVFFPDGRSYYYDDLS